MAENQASQTIPAVQTLRQELIKCNFDNAKLIEREQGVPPQAVASIVSSTFESFCTNNQYTKAIEIGKAYNLHPDKINDAIYNQFRLIVTSGDFEKAIEWAMVYNLPEYEINRAALKGIENAIIAGEVKQAIEIKKKYAITEEQIGNFWQAGYDSAILDQKFMEAALLSREFGMSERKTVITASRAFKKFLRESNFSGQVLVEAEFRLFNDDSFGMLSEEDGRSLIKLTEDFFKKNLRNENFRRTVEVIIGLGILYKEFKNHTLKSIWHFLYKQGQDVHDLLLHDERYDDAIWYYRELNLGEENTPDKIRREIFNQAVTCHSKLLENGNITKALDFKKDYDLLGSYSNHESIDIVQNSVFAVLGDFIQKGETKAGNRLIKEYSIPQDEVEVVVKRSVVIALENDLYDIAIDVIEKFKIAKDDFEVSAAAIAAFTQCRNNGYHETAADIGYMFQVDLPEVRKSALLVWEGLIQSQDYKKAAIIKRKHKLTRKMTSNTVRSEYDRLVSLNDIETAQNMRDEYSLNIGIFTWLVEFFKKIIFMLFGAEETESAQIANSPKQSKTKPTKKEPVKETEEVNS